MATKTLPSRMVTPETAPNSGRDVRPSGPGTAASAAITSSREIIVLSPFRLPRVKDRPRRRARRGCRRQSSLSRNVTTVPMMMIAGPLNSAARTFAATVPSVPTTDALRGARRVVDDRRRQVRVRAMSDEFARQRLQIAQPHIDRNRLPRLQERPPVERDLAVLPMAGHEHARLGVVAMGERDARIGRGPGRGSHARTDLKGNPVAARASISSPPRPNMNGSPPLRRSTRLPCAGELDQQRADLLLRQFVIVGLLADIDALSLPPHQIQHAFVGEPVVEHDIGLLHQAKGAERQEVGIARPRADQIDLAPRRLGALRGRAFDRAGKLGVRGAIVPDSARSPIGPSRTASQNQAAHDRRGNRLRDRKTEYRPSAAPGDRRRQGSGSPDAPSASGPESARRRRLKSR